MAAAAAAAPVRSVGHLADYDVGPVVSKGSFGVVHKAVRKSDGRVFALKLVNLKEMKRVDRQEAIDEARMLAQLNHPHVIRHYDSFIDGEDRLNILMEYASKGNLGMLIKTYAGKPMPEDAVWRVFIHTLLGLSHIHAKKIIHRDIKSLNLFIDAHDNIKIGDLGIARALSNHSSFARTILGTPYYLSPELCEDKPYNVKSDVWALGVVLYECCMGRYPFDAQNEGALIRKILRGQYQPIQGPYSAALIQLITSCLSFKPEARPETTSLLRNSTLVAKAKALGIDLNPRPTSALEDRPVYEAAQQQAAVAQPGAPHPFDQGASPGAMGQYQQYPAAAYGAAASPPGPNPYQQAGPYPYQQAGPAPYPQQRPGSAVGPAPQRGAYGSPGAANHPFALQGPPGASPQGGAYASPQGQYGSPHQQQVYGSPHQQQAYGSPHQQQGPGAYVPMPNKDPGNPWDRLAGDINKMQLRESELARHNADRIQQAQANVHAGKRDNLKELMYNAPMDTGRKQQRADPADMQAAGARPTSAHVGAPFATHNAGALAGYQTVSQATMNEAWRATYQPPQYGRRRCPELQITGPSLRAGSARAGGGGGYAAAADDATSFATTSYATTYHR